MNRRTLLQSALAAAGLSVATTAWAQQQTIRLLVGFPPGGNTDTVARVLAEELAHVLGHTVVVENRPGAGGQIAANALKQSQPDGNTLFLSNSHTLSMIPLTVRNPGYETLKDFTAVGLVALSPDVLAVNPEVVGQNVSDLNGLIAWFRANPERASIGVPAPASDPEFAVRLLAATSKLDINPIPYRGDAPVVQDLLAGHIPAGIGAVGVIQPHNNRLHPIAISSPARLASLPNVQTYREQGIEGYGVSGFTCVMAPAGTPQAIITRYNAAITQVVNSPEFSARLSEVGIVPTSSTPAELTARIRDTSAAFAAIIERTGFQIP